ncbi:MAG TPA: M56 family metallopeptidase, partial [Verrucomicrobiae bacterium]|nr:M56 family metallopeptidase [Verrucomicrobiae bacterium]
MNPAFTVLKMTGLLAAEVAVVCLIVLGCEALMGSAPGRRTLWQVCILSVLLVTGLELSGLGRLLGETVRRSGPSKDTRAAPRFEQISTATPAIASPEPFMHIAPAAMQTAVKPAAAKNRPRPIVLALMCVWVAGTSILLCRIVVTRTIMLVICARSTDVIDPALIRVVRELSGQMAIRGGIRIIESARFRAPIAFGLVRRVIGLPPDFGAEHLAAHREVILAHELAHLAARDSWWQLLADFTVMLLWWHPMVWLARRRLQEASEAAADEASLLFPNGPSILAECLLAMGKLIDHAPLRGSSIGGDGFRSGLGRRVQRLLELRKGPWHPRNKVRIALAKMFCPGVLVLGTVLGSGWISPAASMKGTGMNNPLWKRSLPAFALLAFLGSDKQTGAADKAAPPT